MRVSEHLTAPPALRHYLVNEDDAPTVGVEIRHGEFGPAYCISTCDAADLLAIADQFRDAAWTLRAAQARRAAAKAAVA